MTPRQAGFYARVFDAAWRATALEVLERSLTMTAHGHFHWNELRTRNAEQVKAFYSKVIGWTFEGSPTPDGGTYWVASMDGKPVAGLFPLPERFAQVPESWIPFLAVDDVDARVAEAEKAGAKLMMPIFNVPQVGRIAMLMEPSGAGIGWMTPAA